MKSSRSRFQDFRVKIRKGELDPQRYSDPSKPQIDHGHHGRHGGPPAAKYDLKHNNKRLFHEYRFMLAGFYGPVLALLLINLCSALLAPIAPVTLRLVVDYIAHFRGLDQIKLLSRFAGYLPSDPYASLNIIGFVLIATTFVSVALDWLRLLASQRLNFLLAGSLRQRLHEHLSKLSLAQLADYKTGGVVSRIMGDSEQVAGGVQNAILNPFSAFIKAFLTLTIIVFTDWRLAVVSAVLIPPVLLIHFFLFKRLRPMWRNIHDDKSLLSARLTDMYGGIRVVRSFRRERSEHKEFGAHQHTMIRKQQYTAILGRLLNTGWATFVPAIGIVIIWYGGWRLLRGETTVGTLIMFQALILQLIGPITSIIDSFQNLQQNLGALDRVIDVLEQPTDMPDSPNAKLATHARGELTLQNITFAYPKSPTPKFDSPTPTQDSGLSTQHSEAGDRNVIKDLSLHIPAGATLAIVGPSGSGKTTLVNLVARFFDVSAGAILLDHTDIRDYQLQSYRSLFAMVLQDVYLFDGTVADNIAYGKRHATRDEIILAARQANAHEFIAELPNGYDTFIGERGNKLSGGQKQRLSIARAILADPRILILDEATSSLDTQSEHLIQQSLKSLMVNRTTLVIAHRLSTIMHADRIVVLVDGQILEQGTHDELLALGGTYHAMFTQQFQRHRDPTIERIDWEPLTTAKPA